METMRSIILINQLAFIAQSRATTQMSEPTDRLVVNLSNRMLNEMRPHGGLNDAILGKPAHDRAMPRTSVGSHPTPRHSLATIGASASALTCNLPHYWCHMQDSRVAWPSSTSYRRNPSSVIARGESQWQWREVEPFQQPRPVEGPGISVPRNVIGGELQSCNTNVHGSGVGTGFYRDGFCSTGHEDIGRHTVCIEATPEFLEFSKSVGNDISTPNAEFIFPGVEPGDRWCLCLLRWEQALEAGMAPHLSIDATHEKTLQDVDLGTLMKYAIDEKKAKAEVARLDDMRAMLERAFAKPSAGESPV